VTAVLPRAVDTYLAEHRGQHLAELCDFIRFPSVSALPEHAADVQACAEWLAEQLAASGLEHVALLATGGNPIVYGDWLHAGPGAPVALVYGHYDVQPADPLELWTTPPFEPTIRDDKLYARGSSDNKGQIFAALKAVEAPLATHGALGCNVKVIVEGEEEVRADHLMEFVRANSTRLAADVAVITDNAMYARGVPALPIGLRGMAAVEVTLRAGEHDLHSGLYGGTVPNALHALVRLLSGLHGDDGRVTVEGFYDRVRPLDEDERREWQQLPFSEHRFRSEAGQTELVGEEGYSPLERIWARPTLEVHGIWGGYQGGGMKTVIPAVAHAKVSCRLVADQDPHEILQLLRRHIERNTPHGTSIVIETELAGAWPVLLPRDHPAVRAATAALAAAYAREPVIIRSGWSVPATEILQRHLGLPSVLLGFALPNENAHAPDEHFHLENFDGGIRTMSAFWDALTAMTAAART
jgi:acetylornithine deacetylase/succinyl-diaminopimelate desuccinylase-like protein